VELARKPNWLALFFASAGNMIGLGKHRVGMAVDGGKSLYIKLSAAFRRAWLQCVAQAPTIICVRFDSALFYQIECATFRKSNESGRAV